MNKYLVPIGLVWVGLALVVGMVLVSSAKTGIKTGGVNTIIKKEVQYVKPPVDDKEAKKATLDASVQVGLENGQALAEVEVE